MNEQKRHPKLTPTRYNTKSRIGKRENDMLASIFRYRFLTTNQIFSLHFPKGSQSYCNERLRVLFHKPYQYVNRLVLPVEWGKGSPKLAYSLTKQGSDYLQSIGLKAPVTSNKAHKMKSGTLDYRKHEIAINDVRIAVEKACSLLGWILVEWVSDVEFKNPDLLRQMRVQDTTTNLNIPVAPDGFFSIKRPNVKDESVFFLELDRGTMENKRFRLKVRGYHLFGDKWRGIPFFKKYKDNPFTYRVITVIDGGVGRTHNLQVNGAEKEFYKDDYEDQIKKSRRFWFTELSNISPETIFAKDIWLVPFQSRTTEERFALFDKI